MGCMSKKQDAAHTDELPARRPDELRRSLTTAPIRPVARGTRDTDRQSVTEQRLSAVQSLKESSLLRQSTRLALSQQPRAHRMSRLGTAARGMLVQNIETQSKSPTMKRPANAGKAASLNVQLASLGLASVEMEGDGNCQFRALADQLFGSQQHHAVVRAAAVAHMKAADDYFGMCTYRPIDDALARTRAIRYSSSCAGTATTTGTGAQPNPRCSAHVLPRLPPRAVFETPQEFSCYLRDMTRSRTWGDELTLRAAVEAFGCVAHVVTSEEHNWYLVYTPESPPPDDVTALVAKLCKTSKQQPPPPKKEVFINYISPIHYNAVCPAGPSSL